MEIAPKARRQVWTARAALLLIVLIVAPVTMLSLIPTVFGLERFVMTSDVMSGSIDRGAIMFDRTVPASDVNIGDVVSFRPPEASGVDHLVTRRVVEASEGSLQTQADTRTEPDAWRLSQSDYPTISRLVVSLPYVGYPFLLAEGRLVWPLLLGAGGLLAAFGLRDVGCSRSDGRHRSVAVRT